VREPDRKGRGCSARFRDSHNVECCEYDLKVQFSITRQVVENG
jgi:hypothetical protein